MYDPNLVQPMRDEMTQMGAIEMRTSEEVGQHLDNAKGTTMVFINSVCGCSAGGARPGIAMALNHAKLPDKVTTVFAGQDREATEAARAHFHGYPASSPSIALLKDGDIVTMIGRHEIEGFSPEQIAEKLTSIFDQHC
jgi:putative YphP/YqiW family bacilliredoxin